MCGLFLGWGIDRVVVWWLCGCFTLCDVAVGVISEFCEAFELSIV